MKPRSSLYVLSLSVLLVTICTGMAGATPLDTRAALPTPPPPGSANTMTMPICRASRPWSARMPRLILTGAMWPRFAR